MGFDLSFYSGKKVFLTGHTGFKGSWMTTVLVNTGAHVTGFSSCTPKENSLFKLCGLQEQITHIKGDIRDLEAVKVAVANTQPEIVIHMAAQPLVRESYRDPYTTYSTNVMGTVNILEAVRQTDTIRSFVNVTTDKVYENKEWEWGYRENETLDGFDPYSNSKSCSELVTHSYKSSFFSDGRVAISTARAGNVIGGGDFAKNRIIPDCVRAAIRREPIIVRNCFSTRPYQHVLEPIYAYLMIAGKQYEDSAFSSSYNVGPDEQDCLQTGALVELFVKQWGEGVSWKYQQDNGPHEASYLKLDCSKLKTIFGWKPRWDLQQAVTKVVEWSKVWAAGEDVRRITDRQIEDFLTYSK